jgi:hypothetical protein
MVCLGGEALLSWGGRRLGLTIVFVEKVRTARARVRRNFYSDFTAKRVVRRRITSGASCSPYWRTCMESHNLALRKLFANLLREDAGMSSTQFAVVSALVVLLYLLALLAARLSN